MRILIVSQHYGLVNGASICTCELIAQWSSFVERIDIVCSQRWYKPEGISQANNVFTHRLPYFTPLAVRTKCKTLINKNTILYGADDYGVLGKTKDIPYVLTYHGNWPKALGVSLSYFLKGIIHIPAYIVNFRFADIVVCPSYFPMNWVSNYTSQVRIIRYGIRLASYNIKPDLLHPSLITVGRIEERKGKLLVDVIKILLEIGGQKPWHLYIVGEILYEPLNQLIDNNHVFSLGFVPNVADYVKEADVFILASSSDLEPLALTEAMALSKPAVCFDVGGISGVSSHETGFLIPPFDTKKFAESSLSLLYDEDQRKVKGEKAKEAVQEFDWHKSALQYLDIFNELLLNNSHQ